MSPQSIFDPFSTANVASSAVAHLHNELPDRFVAKHVIERRHAGNRRSGDPASLTHAEQSFRRQIAIMILDGLEDRDDRFGLAPELVERIINKFQINRHRKFEVRTPLPDDHAGCV